MEYTQIAANAFDQLQMNAGIVCRSFNPATGAVSGILGTTTGGVSVNTNPSYVDFGEDMDNVPGGTKQLKRVTGYDPVLSGTLISMDDALGGALYSLQSGPFEFSGGDDVPTHVVPKNGVLGGIGLWLVGDYSAVNETDSDSGVSAGFCAIHLSNAINTAGWQWQTADEGKGQFAFEFHGHYDLTDIDTVPYELYVQGHIPAITKQPQDQTVAAGDTVTFKVVAIGADNYQWQYSADDGATWVDSTATGNKTDTVRFNAQASFNGYLYRCVMTNSLGTAMTDEAALTIST